MISAKAPRRRRLSAEAQQMLPWCVALSAAAHVLLLAGIAPPSHGAQAGPRTAHAGGRPARDVRLRLIQPVEIPFVSATAATAAAASAAVAMAATPSSAAPAPDGAATVADALAPTGLVSSARTAEAQVDAASASASDASGEAGAGIEATEGGYVPRPLLSVAPAPVIPVVIAVPPASATGRLIGRYSGVLALYIDEEGRVRRVEAESPAMPAAMERAAREAFLAARFSSGQVAGRAVKSRIRVEVVFDDGPASSASAPASASASAASAAPRDGASAASRAGASASPAGPARSGSAPPGPQRSP